MATKYTLVLNKHFYAIQICDWKKTLSLVYQGHAQAVDRDGIGYDFAGWAELSAKVDDPDVRVIHTPNLRLLVPEIIRLMTYDHLPKSEVKFTRRNVYEHYNFKCAYCGEKFKPTKLNMDHVIPKSRNGRTTWKNMVPSCVPCNTRKGNRTPTEAKMPLLYKPSRPTWRSPQDDIVRTVEVCPISWQKFVDKKLWDNYYDENSQ